MKTVMVLAVALFMCGTLPLLGVWIGGLMVIRGQREREMRCEEN